MIHRSPIDRSKPSKSDPAAQFKSQKVDTLNAWQTTSLQNLANSSPRAMQFHSLQTLANKHFEAIQRTSKDATYPGSLETSRSMEFAEPENRNGLPAQLKAGIENLSGLSMADVSVHRNSSKPAAVGAHAFAMGTEIHLGPGQDKHLAHEAWHVVQQKQGRVRPTMQAKGIEINDDKGLEKEADLMGAKALQPAEFSSHPIKNISTSPDIIQRLKIIVNGRVIHINEYHFISLFFRSRQPKSGHHDVVISDFNDFEGLSAFAKEHLGENFTYGGIDWGWNGSDEIFPIHDGKTCVRLSADHISQLISFSQLEVKPTQDLLQNKQAKKAFDCLSGLKKDSKSDTPKKLLSLPKTLKLCDLPETLIFAPGKHFDKSLDEGGDKVEGFLIGPGGSKEQGPHLHIFFSCSALSGDQGKMTRPICIHELHLTTSAKTHVKEEHGILDGKTEIGFSKEKEVGECKMMLAMVEVLGRMNGDNVSAEKEKQPDEVSKDFSPNIGYLLSEICGYYKVKIDLKTLKHCLAVMSFDDALDICLQVWKVKTQQCENDLADWGFIEEHFEQILIYVEKMLGSGHGIDNILATLTADNYEDAYNDDDIDAFIGQALYELEQGVNAK